MSLVEQAGKRAEQLRKDDEQGTGNRNPSSGIAAAAVPAEDGARESASMRAQDNILPIEPSVRPLANHDRRVGSILVAEGLLDPRDIKRVLALQQAEGFRFGEAALRLKLISANDLRRAIAKQYDLPVLLSEDAQVSRELVVAFQPFHSCAEEIRALRTQLLIRWMKDGIQRRMLAVVSPRQGEGRSYVVANLAVAFSQLGERTLLIDTDLRRPRQHQIFGLTNRFGLSAVLSGRADRSTVAAVPDLEMLSVLPAGEPPPNPLELLSRTAFSVLLRELQADFDVILFDTPPAILTADAQSIALQAGSALVIARKDHTTFADTARVIKELKDTGARTLGTAFNAF